MTQVRLSSNAPSPQMLPQRRSRLAMSSVRLKLCSTERRDGLWRKNLFMLQAIWQLRPVLGVQVRAQRYGIRRGQRTDRQRVKGGGSPPCGARGARGFFGPHISVMAWRQPAALSVWFIRNGIYWSGGPKVAA